MELKTDVTCPKCGHKFSIKVADMVPGRKTRCPRCPTEITFSGDDGRKAQQALDDLERSLKKWSR